MIFIWMMMHRSGEDPEVDASTSEPVTAVTSAAAVGSWWRLSVESTHLWVRGWNSRCALCLLVER